MQGHYTKVEFMGSVSVPGAHGLSFKDPNTLYVSIAMGNSKQVTGGVVTVKCDTLEVEQFISANCSYYAIALGPSGSVAVRNRTANELEIYSQEATKVFNIQLPMGKHKGMAVNENGHIYICDAESDCIRVYGHTGDLDRVIKDKDIKLPQYIALTNNGFVVTCMGDEPCLVYVDNLDKVLWSYDDVEFPAGVAVDDNNDIYVCDAEDTKVIMVTRDGELSFDIIDEHMLKHEDPFSVAVCGNKLAVQMKDSDTVKVYKLTS